MLRSRGQVAADAGAASNAIPRAMVNRFIIAAGICDRITRIIAGNPRKAIAESRVQPSEF
ncbi:MAG: hypothetical protein D6728_07470 [Cyanobacteria bacterium J055]|nr:MAG: hypothetical protein D6728_07470 [Cyanobacteria bacterium J055]